MAENRFAHYADADTNEQEPNRFLKHVPRRSAAKRLFDGAVNQFYRNTATSLVRDTITNPEGVAAHVMSALPGVGFVGDLQRNFGRALGPAGQERLRQTEIERRERFAAVSSADPWSKVDDTDVGVMGGLPVPGKAKHAAFALTGTLLGAATDPLNLVTRGRTATGRIAFLGASNAALDATAQGADIEAGVSDRFDWLEVGASGALGLGLGTLGEVARPVASWVRDAFTDPPAAPHPGAAGGPHPSPGGAGPGPQPRSGRFRTEEEVHAEFEAKRAREEAAKPAPKPEPQGPPRPVSGTEAKADADGRFRTDNDNFVRSDAGGPIRFDDQKAAAAWVLRAQRESPDQLFEIAVHPTETVARGPTASRGAYTVRERGRSEVPPSEDPALRPGSEEPSANAPPAAVAEAPRGDGGAPPPPEGPGPGAVPGAAPAPPTPHAFVEPMQTKGFFKSIGKQIDEKGLPGAVAEGLARLYTAGVSHRHPLARAVERLRSGIEAETGAPREIAPGADPRKLASVGMDVMNIGHADVTLGIHGYRSTTPDGPSLQDVIVAATARALRGGMDPDAALKAFNDYLTDWRGMEEWDRYDAGVLDREPLPVGKGGGRAELEAHGAATEHHYPHFVELAKQVNEIGRAIWKKAFDGGLVSREAYESANAARAFYVPFKRVMDEDGGKVSRSPANKASVAKGFKGSQRNVVGPIEMLTQQIYEVNRRIRQNDINVSLVNMAEELDKLLPEGAENGILRRLKRPIRPVTATPEELIRAGLDDIDEGLTLYRPGEINEGGRPVIYAWRDGKPEAWEIVDQDLGRDLYNALTGMDQHQGELLLTILRSPAQWLRKGVVTHPAFLVSNFIADQMTNFIINPDGFVPGEGVRGVASELSKGGTPQLYLTAGGVSGGRMTAGLREWLAHNDIMALRAQGLSARYSPVMSDGTLNIGNIFNIPEIAESGTRLALFKRAFERAKAEGFSDWDALIEAQHTARDPLDFGRFGSRMLFAMRSIPFLNSAIQGTDKSLRVLFGDPISALTRVDVAEALRPLFFRDFSKPLRREDARAIRTAYKAWTALAALTVVSIAIAAIYRDDEEYQNIPEYIRAQNWLFRVNGQWVAVRKPFQLAVPMTIGERAFEAAYHDDPTSWARMARGVGLNVAMPADNPLQRTAVELATNKNFLTGGSIVPESKTGLLPEDQASVHTSALAKMLGDALNISPSMIDHAATGFGGSWGGSAMRYSNLTDPDRPAGELADVTMMRRFFPEWHRGAQNVTDFYNRVGSRTSVLQRRLASVTEDLKSQDPAMIGRAGKRIDEADEPGRIWIQTQLAGRTIENGEMGPSGGVPKLHPLNRAKAVTLNVGRMINELYGQRVKDQGGAPPDDRVWHPELMDPSVKSMVQNVLEQYQVAEVRNAMIASRQPGFEHIRPSPRDAYVAQMDAIDPAIMQELDRRLAHGNDRAFGYEAIMRHWPEAEARVRRDGLSADLRDLARQAAAESAE